VYGPRTRIVERRDDSSYPKRQNSMPPREVVRQRRDTMDLNEPRRQQFPGADYFPQGSRTRRPYTHNGYEEEHAYYRDDFRPLNTRPRSPSPPPFPRQRLLLPSPHIDRSGPSDQIDIYIDDRRSRAQNDVDTYEREPPYKDNTVVINDRFRSPPRPRHRGAVSNLRNRYSSESSPVEIIRRTNSEISRRVPRSATYDSMNGRQLSYPPPGRLPRRRTESSSARVHTVADSDEVKSSTSDSSSSSSNSLSAVLENIEVEAQEAIIETKDEEIEESESDQQELEEDMVNTFLNPILQNQQQTHQQTNDSVSSNAPSEREVAASEPQTQTYTTTALAPNGITESTGAYIYQEPEEVFFSTTERQEWRYTRPSNNQNNG
jgi:hypothetical protein